MPGENQPQNLLQFVGQLNEQHFADNPLLHLSAGPQIAVGAQFKDLSLRTQLLPLVCCADQRILGYDAKLHAVRAFAPVAEETVLAGVMAADEWIAFDRLCRILHALNFIARQATGLLFVRVSTAFIQASTEPHGSIFETMLKVCGLPTGRVVMLLAPTNLEHTLFAAATRNYRERGYRIGIEQLPVRGLREHAAAAPGVDFICLPQAALLQAESSPATRRRLHRVVRDTHASDRPRFIANDLRSTKQMLIATELGVFAVRPNRSLSVHPESSPALMTTEYRQPAVSPPPTASAGTLVTQ